MCKLLNHLNVVRDHASGNTKRTSSTWLQEECIEFLYNQNRLAKLKLNDKPFLTGLDELSKLKENEIEETADVFVISFIHLLSLFNGHYDLMYKYLVDRHQSKCEECFDKYIDGVFV